MKRRVVGTVVSAKAEKTIRVEVMGRARHQKYHKYITTRLVCHAHDERCEAKAGDSVVLIESRPMSRLKRWVVAEVIGASPGSQS